MQQKCQNGEACSLHLHALRKSDISVARAGGEYPWGPIHSNRKTVGMVLATGMDFLVVRA